MLGGKIPFFVSQKMPVNCKALFPRWKLKTCKFYGVSNIKEQFAFAAHCFLEDLLTLQLLIIIKTIFFKNGILMSKKRYQFPKKEERYMQLRSTIFSFGPYLCVSFAEKEKYVLLTLIFEKHNVSHTA